MLFPPVSEPVAVAARPELLCDAGRAAHHPLGLLRPDAVQRAGGLLHHQHAALRRRRRHRLQGEAQEAGDQLAREEKNESLFRLKDKLLSIELLHIINCGQTAFLLF